MNIMNPNVVSVLEAIELGAIEIFSGAVIDPGVFIVLCEDDGHSCGLIKVGPCSRIRVGSIICSGTSIGENSVIGHNVVIRRNVHISSHSVISHGVCLERDTVIGSNVRISALTHITGGTIIEDNVQIGARVVTVNDKAMTWRDSPNLVAPIFRTRCRVGSGATILAGIEIGEGAFVGAGSTVTKHVPPNAIVWGTPARVQREVVCK